MKKKSIAKNSLYNSLYSGVNVIFPLISITYFSRILLPEGFGKIEYARSIVIYFLTTASLGIPIYGVKLIAQAGDDLIKRSRSFWEMFYLNALSTIISSITYYIFISCCDYFDGRRTLFYIIGCLLLLNIANIDWYYQGIEDYGYITKRSIAIKIISFILMVIFVKNFNDYTIYAAFICFAAAGNYIFNIFHIRGQIKFINVRNCHIFSNIKPILILLASTLATEIYNMLDSVLLEFFHGEIYVGYYSNAVKIVKFIYVLMTSIIVPFYPRISAYIKEHMIDEANNLISIGCKVLIIFAFPASIGIFFTADALVAILLGNSFIPAINCIKILSVLIIIFSFASLLGHIVLIASGNENRILIATICGAILNTILNLLLIPKYKHYGAAFASVIAEIVVTAILLSKSRHLIKLKIEKSFFISVFLSLAIMIFSLDIIKLFTLSIYIKFILCLTVGIITYFSALIIFKNQVILDFYVRMKRYFRNKT